MSAAGLGGMLEVDWESHNDFIVACGANICGPRSDVGTGRD